jgi:hypothetical protein
MSVSEAVAMLREYWRFTDRESENTGALPLCRGDARRERRPRHSLRIGLGAVFGFLAAVLPATTLGQTLLASYPLITDLADSTGTYGNVYLLGGPAPAPPSAGNPLCLNGIYDKGNGGQEVRTPDITALDSNNFRIDVEFRLSGLRTFWSPVIMGGTGYRWIGLYVSSDGTLGAKFNNSNYTWSSTKMTPGRWYAAQIRFQGGTLHLVLDGALVHTVTVGTLETGGYLNFTTDDFSNGSAFYGCIRNLSFYNGGGTVPMIYVPSTAHAQGVPPSFWKTRFEVHNRSTVQAQCTVALLKRDQDNSSPQIANFQLGPGQSVVYTDALSDLFGFAGAATLRAAVTAGDLLMWANTYNDQPTGTFGQYIPGLGTDKATTENQEVRLAGLSYSPDMSIGYRTNLGVASACGVPITVNMDLYDSGGSLLGRRTFDLRPYESKQETNSFSKVTSLAVNGGYAVIKSTSAGARYFAYGSVVENRTGDPIYIPAQ